VLDDIAARKFVDIYAHSPNIEDGEIVMTVPTHDEVVGEMRSSIGHVLRGEDVKFREEHKAALLNFDQQPFPSLSKLQRPSKSL
jgi:hypothetical protein